MNRFENLPQLTIKLDDKTPITATQLKNFYDGVAKDYKAYTTKRKLHKGELYIESVKSGSIITTFVESLTPMLPLAEKLPTLIEYGKSLFELIDLVKDFKSNTVTKENSHHYERIGNIEQIINTAGQNNNVSITINNYGPNALALEKAITPFDAAIIRANIPVIEQELKIPITSESDIVELRWHQARNTDESSPGDKVVIGHFSTKPVKVLFGDEALKKKMLSTKQIFHTLFKVKVEVIKIKGKIKSYTVIEICDIIPDL